MRILFKKQKLNSKIVILFPLLLEVSFIQYLLNSYVYV